jgi:hypothetical protein
MTPDQAAQLVARLLAGLAGDRDAQRAFVDELVDVLAAPFADGFSAGSEAIGGAITFGPADPRAIAWAQAHAAELVTQVDETTRQSIRDLVSSAMQADEGLTVGDITDQVIGALDDASVYRAERIARTETALAYNHGTLDGYRAEGFGYVEVMDGPGCLPDGHDDTADPADPDAYGLQPERQANGQIWSVDEAAEYPVGHPNCVRAFAAVVPPAPAEDEESIG